MAKLGSSSLKGRTRSAKKSTRGDKSRVGKGVRTPKRNVKGTRVESRHKKGDRKADMAKHNNLQRHERLRSTKVPKSQSYKRKKFIEKKAEGKAIKYFKKQGYEVHPMQHDGIHGVDLGVIKRDKRGEIKEAGVVEVKGSSVRTPSKSAFKNQVRSSYYVDRLRKSRDKGVKGSSELYRLAKNNSKRLKSMAFTSGPQGDRLYKIPPRGPISNNYQSVTV